MMMTAGVDETPYTLVEFLILIFITFTESIWTFRLIYSVKCSVLFLHMTVDKSALCSGLTENWLSAVLIILLVPVSPVFFLF